MMANEWVSQSRARALFGLTADDLQANVSQVIDQRERRDDASGDGKIADVKSAKCPRVPLTVRLVTNPRGYYLPMRLYKIAELEQLSALKKANAAPTKTLKKVVKRSSKHRRRSSIPSTESQCMSNGHNFEPAPDGVQQCTVCGQRVEVEEI